MTVAQLRKVLERYDPGREVLIGTGLGVDTSSAVGLAEEINAHKPADCLYWQRRGPGKAVLLHEE